MVIMVSPSKPQAVVFEVALQIKGLYDVDADTMFKYEPVLTDWIVVPMLNVSAVASGPSTGVESD